MMISTADGSTDLTQISTADRSTDSMMISTAPELKDCTTISTADGSTDLTQISIAPGLKDSSPIATAPGLESCSNIPELARSPYDERSATGVESQPPMTFGAPSSSRKNGEYQNFGDARFVEVPSAAVSGEKYAEIDFHDFNRPTAEALLRKTLRAFQDPNYAPDASWIHLIVGRGIHSGGPAKRVLHPMVREVGRRDFPDFRFHNHPDNPGIIIAERPGLGESESETFGLGEEEDDFDIRVEDLYSDSIDDHRCYDPLFGDY
jgi:hypothetical protein